MNDDEVLSELPAPAVKKTRRHKGLKEKDRERAKKKNPSQRGQSPLLIDKKLFEALLPYGPTLSEMCNHFDVHENTIKNFCKREYNTTYTELMELKMGSVRIRLRQKAITMALNNGDRTMLIFCLKNLCGWSDNPDSDKMIKENLSEIKNKISRIEYSVKKPVEMDESIYDK